MPDETKRAAGRSARKQDSRWRIIAQNAELYSSAYRTALSALQKPEQPNLALRLHASIRRQIKEGAKNPLLIAAHALSDLQTYAAVTHKKDARKRRKHKAKSGSLDQFVLIKASKSFGGVWSDADYIVRDRARNVVGRIMLHPQAPKDKPWFWTITARQIPPSVHNHGYSATREQAMAGFKARWAATTN